MPRWQWILAQFTRRLWVRATLIGMLGVAAALLAALVERFIPWLPASQIGADAVYDILTIIASSMLAVTTFSLSVMTSAYGSAASNVTPRATRLLMEDSLTQNVLSTFIGSFLFSMVGIVVLKTGAYGDRGRFVLFLVTVAVIVLIVVSLLRWIDHLTRLGQVGETTRRVEQATREAIARRRDAPCLGGLPLLRDALPADALAVRASTIGYVQFIDMEALSLCAERHQGFVQVVAIPGTFVHDGSPLAWFSATPGNADLETVTDAVRSAFSIGDERSYDQDPRFGLMVMSEIACRALSPAVNDHGTAIDVIGRLARLLSLLAAAPEADAEPIAFPKVQVAALAIDDLFEDAFMLIARDGAGQVEIQLRLQKCLQALALQGDAAFRSAALQQAALALERANGALPLEAEKQRLRRAIDMAANP